MKPGSRLVLPLVAAGVLLAVALAVVLWPARPVQPAPVEAAPVVTAPAVPEPERVAPSVRPTPAAASVKEAAPVAVEEGPATEVALRPGDEVPEPEREGPPQENDPIEPEKPQTARWKHQKTEHIRTLLGRDLERLEREREQAEARGDGAEARRLATLIRRQREHHEKLGEDLKQLAEAAKHEPPEP